MKEKEVKEERMEERKEKVNEKGVVKMEKERKEERMEVKKNNENKKGGCKMKEKEGIKEVKELEGGYKMKENKEVIKELVSEVEKRRMLLIETVFKWAQSLSPMKNVHVKVKGRYYPLIEKESGKVCLIDKVQSRKIPFETLESSMQFITACTLAERKEEIEKEVEEGKKKYLERKLEEIDQLLSKF